MAVRDLQPGTLSASHVCGGGVMRIGLGFLQRRAKRFWARVRPLELQFSEVYNKNMWCDPESRSGPGSRRDSGSVTDTIAALNQVCDKYKIASIADIPCGDFNWMGAFLQERPAIAYTGYDIVRDLIAANCAKHPGVRFEVLNIVANAPVRADLIISKDLLNHLTYAHVRKALANMKKSGAEWLLASNNFGERNQELDRRFSNASRHLDITVAPLHYAAPVWRTHYLGLWRLADL